MSDPKGLISIGEPISVDMLWTPGGQFFLDIQAQIPGEPTPSILRVALTKDDLFRLSGQIEATRRQFGFPLPAVFSQPQTRQ